uniref:Uncharacterized protein n=1 Tax=Arundo donax TaxID=35708 RepID=A0A0A9BH88_ARUDO
MSRECLHFEKLFYLWRVLSTLISNKLTDIHHIQCSYTIFNTILLILQSQAICNFNLFCM